MSRDIHVESHVPSSKASTTSYCQSDADSLDVLPRNIALLLHCDKSDYRLSIKEQLLLFSGGHLKRMPKVKAKRSVWKPGFFSRSSTVTETPSEFAIVDGEPEESRHEDAEDETGIEMRESQDEEEGGRGAPELARGCCTRSRRELLLLAGRLSLHVVIYWLLFVGCFGFISYVKIGFDISPFFLPSGVHILAFALGGPYLYPAYLVVELFCTFYMSTSKDVLPGAARALWPVVKGIIFVFEAQALRYKMDLRFKRGMDILWFSIITTVAHVLAGILYAAAMVLVGKQIDFADVTFTRAVAHSVGAFSIIPLGLTLLPYALAIRFRGARCPTRAVVWRVLVAPLAGFTLLIATTAFTFVGDPDRMPRLYAYFLNLTFGATVYGRVGGITTAFVVNMLVTVILSIQNRPVWTNVEAELYCIVISFMGIVIGVVIDNDYEKGKALRRAASQLEKKIVMLSAAHTLTQALSKAKEQFMDDISHEVRTPLHGMLGYLSLLSVSPLSTAQRRWVATMQGSATLLISIVDDLLDISKVASGRALSVRPSEFHVGKALEEAVALTAGMMGAVSVELMSVVEPDLGLTCYADRQNLQRVVLNLLSNALKFTAQGSVILKASLMGLDAEWVELRVEIVDTGCGIKVDDMQKLFQRFSQLGTVSKRAGGKGTGLGLAISKDLVETTMGGVIGVTSAVEVGSTFWFTARLPRSVSVFTTDKEARTQAEKSAAAAAAAKGEETPGNGQDEDRVLNMSSVNSARRLPMPPLRRPAPVVARALLIHPCQNVCKIFGEALRELGCAVYACTSLHVACDAVLSDSGRHWTIEKDPLGDQSTQNLPDSVVLALPLVVFFDSSFDPADLVLFAHRIQDPAHGPIMRVLLNGRSEEIDENIDAAGIVDMCFRKPLCFTSLQHLLQEIISGKPARLEDSKTGTMSLPSDADDVPPSLEGARIMIVDDNIVNQMLAQELLENLGVRAKDIMVANDGEQAVASYKKNFKRLDLIFMDCRMPVLDGFGATRRIRQMELDVITRRGYLYGQSDDESSGEGTVGKRKKRPKDRLPIVALTAESVECTPKCLAADMNDVLMKPFTEQQLRDMVNKWVFRTESGRNVQFTDDLSTRSGMSGTNSLGNSHTALAATAARNERGGLSSRRSFYGVTPHHMPTTPAMAGRMLDTQAARAQQNAHRVTLSSPAPPDTNESEFSLHPGRSKHAAFKERRLARVVAHARVRSEPNLSDMENGGSALIGRHRRDADGFHKDPFSVAGDLPADSPHAASLEVITRGGRVREYRIRVGRDSDSSDGSGASADDEADERDLVPVRHREQEASIMTGSATSVDPTAAVHPATSSSHTTAATTSDPKMTAQLATPAQAAAKASSSPAPKVSDHPPTAPALKAAGSTPQVATAGSVQPPAGRSTSSPAMSAHPKAPPSTNQKSPPNPSLRTSPGRRVPRERKARNSSDSSGWAS